LNVPLLRTQRSFVILSVLVEKPEGTIPAIDPLSVAFDDKAHFSSLPIEETVWYCVKQGWVVAFGDTVHKRFTFGNVRITDYGRQQFDTIGVVGCNGRFQVLFPLVVGRTGADLSHKASHSSRENILAKSQSSVSSCLWIISLNREQHERYQKGNIVVKPSMKITSVNSGDSQTELCEPDPLLFNTRFILVVPTLFVYVRFPCIVSICTLDSSNDHRRSKVSIAYRARWSRYAGATSNVFSPTPTFIYGQNSFYP
jgi:hypothetical protein